ncbi:MAG: glycosyltransferase [Anaerolineae bacterium]
MRASAGRPLRVVMFSTVQLNPYVGLLAGGVRAAAPDVQVTCESRLSLEWVRRNRRQADILHIHWPELQYAGARARTRWRRFCSFMAGLVLAHHEGLGVVYTVHNLGQHEGRDTLFNALANAVLFAWADALHVHDEAAAEVLRSRMRRPAHIHVIPHGSYVGWYPDGVGRQEARRQLDVAEESFVYLMLGGLRPYKGAEELIQAFAGLPGDNLQLIIAGHAHEPAYALALEELARGQDRIRLFLEHVPDERVQYFMRAADVCVLPYRRVTTSGAAVLALSFHKPIVVPAIGPFPALVRAAAGICYEPAGVQDLRQALEAARALDMEKAGQAIAAYLETITWERVGAEHAVLYRQIAGGKEAHHAGG